MGPNSRRAQHKAQERKKKAHIYGSGGGGGGTKGPDRVDKRGEEKPCPYCDRVFKQAGRLQEHLRSKHAEEEAEAEAAAAAAAAAAAGAGSSGAGGGKMFDVGSRAGYYDRQSPKAMLQDYCRSKKRPTPKYQPRQVGGGWGCKCVLPDPKHKDKDEVVFLAEARAAGTKEEAAQLAAVAMLQRVQGNRALHLTLPAAYHDLWHELCDRGRSQEEKAAAREARAVEREARDRRRREIAARTKAIDVFLSDDKRRLVEGILRELRDGADGRPGSQLHRKEDLGAAAAALLPELVALGFGEADAAAAAGAVDEVSTELKLSDCLDWLCLNLDPSELPTRFARAGSGAAASVLLRGSQPGVGELEQVGYSAGDAVRALGESAGDPRAALERLFRGLAEHGRGAASITAAGAPPVSAAGPGEEWAEEVEALGAIFEEECAPRAGGGVEVRLQVDPTPGPPGTRRRRKGTRVTVELYPPLFGAYPAELGPTVAVTAPGLTPGELRAVTARALDLQAELVGAGGMLYETVTAVEDLVRRVLDGEAIARGGGGPEPEPEARPRQAARSERQSGRRGRDRRTKRSAAEVAGLSKILRAEHEALRTAVGRTGEIQQQRRALPAAKQRREVVEAVQAHQVVVISGATGCGKSTQVPQFVLEEQIEAGRGGECYIICTQPRRISAVGLAERVSRERGDSGPGGTVGYSIRLESRQSEKTRLLFCTTGILLRRLVGDAEQGDAAPGEAGADAGEDRVLEGVSHIVVDEVHERSLESDLLLLLLSDLLARRLRAGRAAPKVVLMSATADAELFAGYFNRALERCQGRCALPRLDSALVDIPGFTHPVEERFLEDVLEETGYEVPRGSKFAKKGKAEARAATRRPDTGSSGGGGGAGAAVEEDELSGYSPRTLESLTWVDESVINYDLLEQVMVRIVGNGQVPQGPSAVLVFLPGMGEIQTLKRQLEGSLRLRGANLWVLPLHGSLPSQEQARVFERPPKGMRKVVLTTNVAETSVTVEDVVCVVDSGKMREMGFDPARGLASLQEAWVSQAAAMQRRGRAGRVRPGTCYRLFSRATFRNLAKYQSPEISRVPLDMLCLRVKSILKSGIAPNLARMLTAPKGVAVAGAIEALQQMRALDPEDEALTPLGRMLVRMPVDAQIGKMLVFGCLLRCLSPCLTIAAALSGRPPFLSPSDKREEANAARDRLAAGAVRSDHLALVAAFNGWHAARERGGRKEGRLFCQENFLSIQGMEAIEASRVDYAGVLADLGFVGREYATHIRRSGSHHAVLEGNEDRHPVDEQAHNARVVKAVLCAALYPRMLRVVNPTAKFKEVEGGTMEKDSDAKETRFYTKHHGRVFVHPRSVNFSAGKFDSGWLVYSSLLETSKVFVTESSMVPAYAVLIFGGRVKVDHEKGLIVVDDWARFQASARVAVLIRELQAQTMAVFERKIAEPETDMHRSRIVDALLQILSTDGF